jgi:hypothetical protein
MHKLAFMLNQFTLHECFFSLRYCGDLFSIFLLLDVTVCFATCFMLLKTAPGGPAAKRQLPRHSRVSTGLLGSCCLFQVGVALQRAVLFMSPLRLACPTNSLL